VNFFVNGTVERTMWRNLLGLVWVRTSGNDEEREQVLQLAAHWRSLGYDVPTFALTAESIDGCCEGLHWRNGQMVDILARPYHLTVMT
jgi:hypothetical protein